VKALLILLLAIQLRQTTAPAPGLDDIISDMRESGVLEPMKESNRHPADIIGPPIGVPEDVMILTPSTPPNPSTHPSDVPSLVPPLDEFGLPAGVWVFELLLPLTFFLHVIFMNMSLGTGLLALPMWLAAGRRPHVADALARLLRAWPVNLSMTITTGVAPLLFVQVLYGHLFYTANVLLGWRWLMILALVLVIFYSVYRIQRRAIPKTPARLDATKPSDPSTVRLLNPPRILDMAHLVVIAILFLVVAWLFTANSTLMLVPDAWRDVHFRGASPLKSHAMMIPRFLHNVIGSLAVCSLGIAVMARCTRRISEDQRKAAISLGLLLACIFTLIQILTGVWFVATVWHEGASAFHNPTAGTILWALAVLSGIAALGVMFRGLERPERPLSVWLPAGLIAFTLAGMSAGRERLRAAFVDRLANARYTAADVHAQTATTWLFFGVLVIGLALIGLMVWWVWQVRTKQAD